MTTSRPGTALVTAGTTGLGRDVAQRLAARGWRLFLGSARPDLSGTAAEQAVSGLVVPLVVTSERSVAAACRRVREHTGHLDLLVNVAARTDRDPAVSPSLDEPGSVYDANVFGPVRVTEAFLPLLRAAARPRVVMVGGGGPTAAALSVVTAVYAETLPDVDFGFARSDDLDDHPIFAEPAVLTPAVRGPGR